MRYLNKHQRFLLAIIGVLLLTLCLIFLRFESVSHQAGREAGQLAQCQKLAQEIRLIQEQTQTDSSRESNTDDDMISVLRKGLQAASIPDTAISDVRIQNRVPIPQTSYSREDIAINLNSLSLKDILEFMRLQESHSPPFVCTGLELRADKNTNSTASKSNTRWSTQITITRIANNPQRPTKKN